MWKVLKTDPFSPPELLDEHSKPLQLQPFSSITSREPVNAQICYPSFNLQDPPTALVLSVAREHPIRLHSALTGQLVASYPLISPTTEAYTKIHSLLFHGSNLIAGSESQISFFDSSRSGQEPFTSLKTGPKKSRGTWSNPSTSVRGFISALAIDGPYNVLAAGTLSRQVGLYDNAGNGECVGAFSVNGNDADQEISGGGITQVLWSACGRYLHVVERKSRGTMIYDIRKTGQLLSWTTGRNASTNQRMNVELTHTSINQDVLAGGTDGNFRTWAAPHLTEGPVEPTTMTQLHNDCVNGIGLHHTDEVLVTADGGRNFENLSSNSSLKIWKMPAKEE